MDKAKTSHDGEIITPRPVAVPSAPSPSDEMMQLANLLGRTTPEFRETLRLALESERFVATISYHLRDAGPDNVRHSMCWSNGISPDDRRMALEHLAGRCAPKEADYMPPGWI